MISVRTFVLWLGVTVAFISAAVVVYSFERFIPVMLVAAATLVGVWSAPRRLGIVSWCAGIPVFYGIVFVLVPLVVSLIGENRDSDMKVADALYIVAFGLGAFIAGVQLGRFAPRPTLSYDLVGLLRIDFQRRPLFLIALACIGGGAMVWGFFFGYFGLVRSDAVEEGAGAFSALGFLLIIAQAISWNTYFKSGKHLFISLLCTFLMLASGSASNSKEMMLLPFLIIGLSYWGVSGKVPYRLIIGAFAFYALIVFPFITASRMATTVGLDRGDFINLTVDYLISGNWQTDAAEYNAIESLGRGVLSYFTEIVEQTGKSVDFFEGRTMMHGLEAMVPRVLIPDKPDLNIGNWTGQAYGLVALSDDITSVSPTLIGEFYMNFGLSGVAIGMVIVGFVSVLVDRYLIVSAATWTMPIFVYFVRWQESLIGQTILPFLKNALLWVPVFILVKIACDDFARLLPKRSYQLTTSGAGINGRT